MSCAHFSDERAKVRGQGSLKTCHLKTLISSFQATILTLVSTGGWVFWQHPRGPAWYSLVRVALGAGREVRCITAWNSVSLQQYLKTVLLWWQQKVKVLLSSRGQWKPKW